MTIRDVHYLSALAVILLVANLMNELIGRPFWPVTQILDFGSENTAPTWLSSVILAAVALTAYRSYSLACKHGVASPNILLFTAFLLLLMSCDEVAQGHEKLQIPGGYLVETLGFLGSETQHVPWLWIGGPIVIAIFGVLAFRLRKVLRYVPGSYRLFVLGAVSIVTGGIFFESTLNWLTQQDPRWLWRTQIIFEEGLELAGSLLLAYCFAFWNESFPDSIRPSPSPTPKTSP